MTVDNVFYHYTDANGCLGILNSRSVWLSDYRYLNDRHELSRALGDFKRHLPEDQRGAFERAFLWHNQVSLHCILSLSHSPKILSQWRAYADDGTGFALGFSQEFLRYANLELFDCIYENHSQFAIELVNKHQASLEEICRGSASCIAENDFMAWLDDHAHLVDGIVRDLLLLKNPAFVEEQEVRAIRTARRGDVSFRNSNGLLVPYIAAKFWPDDDPPQSMHVVLREIWLGPRCHPLNKEALFVANRGIFRIEQYDCGYV